MIKNVRTPVLEIAYEETGPADGKPVVLMHGFPDDIHAYDNVAPPLATAGYRVIGRPGFSIPPPRARASRRRSVMTSTI
jgi:pimeloyl-ACP methyl ester carboxylesterase